MMQDREDVAAEHVESALHRGAEPEGVRAAQHGPGVVLHHPELGAQPRGIHLRETFEKGDTRMRTRQRFWQASERPRNEPTSFVFSIHSTPFYILLGLSFPSFMGGGHG